MKVKEIMKPLLKTNASSSVSDAAKLMSEKNIGSLLIEEEGKITGIITEGDILRRIVAKGRDPKNTSVKEIMSSPLITVDPEKSIEEAHEIIGQKNIRRLLVEHDGDIIGIITLRDVYNNFRYTLGQRITRNRESNYNRPSYGKDV